MTKQSPALVTLGMLTFNQEQFIAEAFAGAVSQTYAPLEIVICDDCSTDGTFRVLQDLASRYTGEHTIRLYRNERNLGFAANLNRAMELAQAEFIVIAAGDDVSKPNRVRRLYEEHRASSGRALSIYSNAEVIDAEGRVDGLYLAGHGQHTRTAAWMAEHNGGVLGCTQAWHRSTFDVFGDLDVRVLREDLVIPFRASLLGEVRYVDEVLVQYRHHHSNINLTAFRQLRGVRHWRSLLDRHTEGNLALLTSRLRDLQTLQQTCPHRAEEIRGLRLLVDANIRDMEIEKELFDSGLLHSISLIIRARRQGTHLRRLVRWTLWFPLATPYYRWLKTKAWVKKAYRTARGRRATSPWVA